MILTVFSNPSKNDAMSFPFKKSLTAFLIAAAPLWGLPGKALANDGELAAKIATVAGKVDAAKLEAHRVEAVPVKLDNDRMLRGVAKTKDGKPAAGATVVLGVLGQPVKKITADKEGNFAFGPLEPGEYQVATRDAAAMLAVYSVAQAPRTAEESVEVSQKAMVARGQSPGGLLTNPWFWGLILIAAIAIPVGIALADDDDNS